MKNIREYMKKSWAMLLDLIAMSELEKDGIQVLPEDYRSVLD